MVVLVDHIEQEARKYGLTREVLQAEVELKFRQNGIKVFSEEEQLQTPGMPFLYINVNVIIEEAKKFAAANIHVAFKQAVLLKRDTTKGCLATTWETGGISTCRPEELKDVREDVKSLIDQFINDYLAANPLSGRQRGRDRGRDRDRRTDELSRIDAVVGQSFVIALDSNPTTGFSWRLASSLPRMLKLQGKRYIPDEPQLIGSGGTEEWTFKAVRSGRATIVFEYVRPWDNKSPPEKKQVFYIVVKKGTGAARP